MLHDSVFFFLVLFLNIDGDLYVEFFYDDSYLLLVILLLNIDSSETKVLIVSENLNKMKFLYLDDKIQ